ncbi:DedA family protein [Prevotella lacticifex]|uniref:Membrane protein n=1 Tax=Prevotella lacticifex TaxID=2854755 RepID=A0A9R1CWF4_9BACT|nr:DedA family protein [Prevotella lacticifex]GJG37335.1 membrane protein [Prevotella lacticifex]GJG40165.1 membrane protein [Prevotella lacticifex]GJG43860.1 membrane protein [Prevotella lacticifex]GJG46543.1 membrane protein [Prevotella lacticifex]GJG49706.1 membrane protein [Prevotella lacticifex]
MLTSLLNNLTYWSIFILMLLESTVIPVPSEFVIAPAAYHSAAGNMNIWLVVLFGTIGADVGATINYLGGYYLGRPIIYRFANSRWGHMCMLNQAKVEKSEKYFDDHGMVATITGRLIPGIRHLISIPAGLAKMKYWQFILYTTLGAGVWNCILAALGWWLHTFVPEEQLDDKIMEYGEYIKFTILILLAVALLYFMAKWFIKRQKRIHAGEDPNKD